MKEPGCTQVPGCKLSKTSPRRPQDVTKKYLNFIIFNPFAKTDWVPKQNVLETTWRCL